MKTTRTILGLVPEDLKWVLIVVETRQCNDEALTYMGQGGISTQGL